MRYRQLGNTGFEVGELCLGTWGLSGDGYGAVDEATQDAVIDRARALGIDLFDTADSYGRGNMEKRLGERLGKDAEVRIVTKLGTNRKSHPAQKCFDFTFLRESFEQSRERLQRDKVDVVLLHNPSALAFENGEAAALLGELKDKGEITAWGASVGDVGSARAAIQAGAQVLELAYNAFFSADLHELDAEVREKHIGILARSVLAHGLLSGTWSRFRTFNMGDHRRDRWTTDQLRKRIDQVAALRTLVGDDIQTVRAGALRYALCNEAVSSVVIGPRSTVHLDQLVREAGHGPPYISDERLKKLSTRLAESGAI